LENREIDFFRGKEKPLLFVTVTVINLWMSLWQEPKN